MHSPARTTTRLLAALLALGAVAPVLAGCSTGTGTSDYPAVLATPAARSDQTMTPDEVKQATDALISERDRLSGGTSSQRTQASAPASTSKAANAGNKSTKRRMQATAPASTTSAETAGNAQ